MVVPASNKAGPTTVPADMPKILLAGFDRKVLAVSDSHVLWSSIELIESTRTQHLPSVIVRYQLQEIGKPETILIDAEVGSWGGWGTLGHFVFSSGLVVRATGDRVSCVDPARGTNWRSEIRVNGNRAACVALYSDGAVFQVIDLGQPVDTPTPAYWVPIKDGALDYDTKWALTGNRGLSSPLKFGRSSDALVWIGASPDENDPAEGGARLFVADLGKRTVETRALPFHARSGYRVEAFDGRTVSTGSHFIDIATGEVTEAVRLSPLGMIDGRLFGTRPSDNWRFDNEMSLVYVDVDRPTEATTLATFKIQEGGPGMENDNKLRLPNAFLVHKERVLIWDGSTWTQWNWQQADRQP